MRVTLILLSLLFPFIVHSNEAEPEKTNPSTALKAGVTSNASILRKHIGQSMQNSAQWFDNLLPIKDDTEDRQASAKGYFSIGTVPRRGDLLDLETQFKVSFDLPNWEHRLKLVIDNNEEESDRLPFQSILVSDDPSLNAALNWYMVKRKAVNLEHRIGVSRRNVYAQSRLHLKHEMDALEFSLKPSVEYYVEDGWGARANSQVTWSLSAQQKLNFAANIRYLESEISERTSIGIFHSHIYNENSAAVTGIWARDSFDGERSYFSSYRYRTRLYEKWFYLELEPFLEYREKNSFNDEFGFAIRLISYYGT